MINADVTLRRLIWELSLWANDHKMINDFFGYGEFLQVSQESERNYPAMIVNATAAPSETWYINYTMEVMLLEYVNDEQENKERAVSNMRQILNDLEETISYSDRWQAFSKIAGGFNAVPAIQKGQDKSYGWVATFTLKVKKRHGICDIQALMPEYDFDTGLITGPTCDPVTITGNTTLMETADSGDAYVFEIKDTDGVVVGTWNALTSIWVVPAVGGDPVDTDFNTTPTGVDTPAGDNLAINVKASDASNIGTLGTNTANIKQIDVSDTTVENSDSSYSVSVVAEGILYLPNITHTQTDGSPETLPAQTALVCNAAAPLVSTSPSTSGQEQSYSGVGEMDEGARFIAGEFASVVYTDIVSEFVLLNNNEWGHKHRYTGDTGGYMDYATGIFYDASNVVTTKAFAFPNDILRDYAFRRRWWLNRSGVRTWAASLTAIGGETKGGETGWNLPTNDEYKMLANNNLTNNSSTNFIDSRLHNWSSFNMWTSTTPKSNTAQAYRYNSGLDLSSVQNKTGTAGNAYVKLF